MDRAEEKAERVQAVKKGFKRVTAAVLVAAALAEMVSVMFVKKKD